MIDLRTGRYSFTPRAPRIVCNEPGLERPIKKGKLTAQYLRSVRTAYLRVLSEGLRKKVCGVPGRPGWLFVNNGGTPILVLGTGSFSGAAPDDFSCWSEAATALHEALDEAFGVRDVHFP